MYNRFNALDVAPVLSTTLEARVSHTRFVGPPIHQQGASRVKCAVATETFQHLVGGQAVKAYKTELEAAALIPSIPVLLLFQGGKRVEEPVTTEELQALNVTVLRLPLGARRACFRH